MKYCKDILDAVGNTPLVRLNKVISSAEDQWFAKIEFMNPGGSVKDRMVRHIIRKAEQRGDLKSGAVIVENSSGNTAAGMSMIAAVNGYECIITGSDKLSDEKRGRIQAFGSKLVICPSDVPADSPDSYYSTAKRIASETPDSFYPDQYNNPDNQEAHYQSTGPEIWEQTEGEIDVFVAGMGTGGTITGTVRYLKEKNPDIQIIGVDPVGSVFYEVFKSGKTGEAKPYKVEGIGEDYLVGAIDFDVIDDVVQVSDQEAFSMARRIIREEGILCGGSSGGVIAGFAKIAEQYRGKNVVTIFPDGGDIYLSKFLNDAWMTENGFSI